MSCSRPGPVEAEGPVSGLREALARRMFEDACAEYDYKWEVEGPAFLAAADRELALLALPEHRDEVRALIGDERGPEGMTAEKLRADLLDARRENERMREALEAITAQDWRGHKPYCVTLAEAALYGSSEAPHG